MADVLAEVDVPDVASLRALGAVDAFRRLKFRFDNHVTFTALYALHAGLQMRDWRDLTSEERADLKRQVADAPPRQ